ncbi:MAG: VCBS repeat-containing protein [Acidobacteria bacterium]|nr:VCBS repeat-containing protein [Acidobacteriota bacterium]
MRRKLNCVGQSSCDRPPLASTISSPWCIREWERKRSPFSKLKIKTIWSVCWSRTCLVPTNLFCWTWMCQCGSGDGQSSAILRQRTKCSMRNRTNDGLAKLLLWCSFVLPAVGYVGAGLQEFDFRDIAAQSGLTFTNSSGEPGRKDYIIESTGCGVAVLDYDRDGKPDLFFANASRLEPFPPGQEPTHHLYRNLGDGRFVDVTLKAGLTRSGWGQGVCAGDYDNDGFEDLFVTYYGTNVLYRNNGDGTFNDVTAKVGLPVTGSRWGTGAAFLDYDRDGRLDLFVANYVDFDLKRTPQRGEKEFCTWRGVPVFCGPRGLPGALMCFTEVKQMARSSM